MLEQVVYAPVRQGVSVDREGLIEEARKKARRRRVRNGAAVVLAVGIGMAAALRFGDLGGGTGGAAQALGGSRAAGAWSVPAVPHLPPETQVVDIAVDAGAPGTIYVGAIHGNPNNARRVLDGRVYQSSDSGRHWRLTTPSHWLPVVTLAADPHAPGTLYAGTTRAILKTADFGRHWRVVSRSPFLHGPDMLPVRYSLTVDPADSRIIYGTGTFGVVRSSDGGLHWEQLTPTLSSDGTAFAIAPTTPEVAYLLDANPGRHSFLYALSKRSTAWRVAGPLHAPARDAGQPLGTANAALAVDPEKPTTLYAAVGSGVLRSTDAGRNWRSIAGGLPIVPGITVTSLAVDPRHTGVVYADLGEDGIFKTVDAGRTWSQVSSNGGGKLAMDPAHPSTIYAAGDNGIVESTDNGRTWTPRS